MLDGLVSMGTTYNSSFCYNVSRGKLVTIECDYPMFYYLESLLYRSFFGVFFDLVEVLLLSALWFCNIWIQRDFMEAYMSSVALPLTVSTIMKIATLVWNFLFPREIEKAWLIDMIYATSMTTSQLTLIQGLPFLLYMATKMGTTRKQNYNCCTWVPFLLVLMLSLPLSAIFNMCSKPTFAAPSLIMILALIIIAMAFMFALIGMGCLAFTCCSGTKMAMDMLDPVVFDARSRLGWVMLFSLAAPITFYPCLYCYVSLAFFLDLSNDYDLLTNEMATRTWNFFFGPSVLIFTFVILPSYRDTILCGCKYRQFTKKVQMSQLNPAMTQISAMTTTPVIPIVSQQPNEKQLKSEPIFQITGGKPSSGKKGWISNTNFLIFYY
ncbi:unnamed protein product [Caenorhabditis angaria]|uniref:Uncharacterized protein n=1 Tax=Caenorhabditis angaria TaxID=860376 RepID=A0A9P1IV37_9PELO|nr:unnamed protein product [Caenorhabditis angaria]